MDAKERSVQAGVDISPEELRNVREQVWARSGDLDE